MVNAMTTMEPTSPPKTISSAVAVSKPMPTAPIPSSAAPASLPAPASNPIIEIDQVDFSYGTHKALHGISLKIEARKVTAFIGPSGCGKSTLLRCLNRMNDLIDGTKVTGGSIKIRGIDINSPTVDVIE